MLVQTKLFAPPATTPEAEMQQKMMKYMMVFMGFMFYKVPSGPGHLLHHEQPLGDRRAAAAAQDDPRAAAREPDGGAATEATPGEGTPRGRRRRQGELKRDGGNGAKAKPPGRFAQFWERVLEEARKDPTYRKVVDERDDKGRETDRDRDRPRPRPRRR